MQHQLVSGPCDEASELVLPVEARDLIGGIQLHKPIVVAQIGAIVRETKITMKAPMHEGAMAYG
jgi:hypothetical protein